jgi:hypothetical protein
MIRVYRWKRLVSCYVLLRTCDGREMATITVTTLGEYRYQVLSTPPIKPTLGFCTHLSDAKKLSRNTLRRVPHQTMKAVPSDPPRPRPGADLSRRRVPGVSRYGVLHDATETWWALVVMTHDEGNDHEGGAESASSPPPETTQPA